MRLGAVVMFGAGYLCMLMSWIVGSLKKEIVVLHVKVDMLNNLGKDRNLGRHFKHLYLVTNRV